MAETQGDLVSNTTNYHECQYGELAKDMERQLNHVRSEHASLQQIVDSKLISIQHGLEDVLKKNLSCPVCKEVVIYAKEAECGHFFCSTCIMVWMKKPSPSCPTCCKPIGSPTRVNKWDTLLNEIYNLLPEETQQSREEILKQRPEQLKAWHERQASSEIPSPSGLPVVPGEKAENDWYDVLFCKNLVGPHAGL